MISVSLLLACGRPRLKGNSAIDRLAGQMPQIVRPATLLVGDLLGGSVLVRRGESEPR